MSNANPPYPLIILNKLYGDFSEFAHKILEEHHVTENLSFEEAIREEKKILENNTSQVDPELKYSIPRSYLAKGHY